MTYQSVLEVLTYESYEQRKITPVQAPSPRRQYSRHLSPNGLSLSFCHLSIYRTRPSNQTSTQAAEVTEEQRPL